MIQRPHASLSDEVLSEIANRLPEQQFLTWFQKVRFEYSGPERIAIYVPNRFHLTYLKHRHLPTISEAIEGVTNLQQPRIEFHIESSAPSPAESEDTGAPSEMPATNHRDLPHSIPLNSDYTFEQFVTGPANRLAHAAAVAVARDPGTSYNPLFIHGAVGLGKTHLMQAVAHVLSAAGMRRLVYLSCASFTNDFIAAVEQNSLEQFRRKYRDADALLIDDIQFLANKERTQEEFFHTFNEIYNQQKQIFLSSDSQPSDIAGLGERLESRFKLGLVVELSPPSFETRVAILRRKGNNLGIRIPEEVAEYVCNRVRENVRELEGAAMRLHSLVVIENRPLTVETVTHSLSDILRSQSRRIDLPRIQQSVLDQFDVRASDLHSKKRSRSIVVPRQICMFLARRHTDHSLGEIGSFFGGRDHSTVLHSIEKIAGLLETDPKIRSSVQTIEQTLL